ncbi:MAG: TlpA disulfide reductase family protein [Neptuniibacter sp.]
MTKLSSAINAILLILAISFPAHATSNTLSNIRLVDVNEQPVTLKNYKGKVVLLNFWATWCPPCIKEMPSMQRLRDHFSGQPFEIVAINVGETATTVSSFMLELDTELTFPILLDQEAKSFGELGLRGLPMSLLIDQDGNIIEKVLGGRDWDNKSSIEFIQNVVDQVPRF